MKRLDSIFILILVLLAVTVLVMFFVPNELNSVVDNTILSVDKSCNTDSDCVTSLRDCSSCGYFPGRCVNKNWMPSCVLPVPKCNKIFEFILPKFKCSCANSKCTEVPKSCAELGLPADCNRPAP